MADNVYEVKWQQSINKGNGNQNYNFVSPTNKAIWDANEINTAWDNSGCYGGANAQNGSLMGSGSGCNFSGWNEDTGKSDMRNFTISPTYYSGTQNLRFMIDFGSGGRGINKRTFNWTGISNDQKTSIENAYLKEGDEGYRTNLSNPISVYSPYTRQYFNSIISGIANTPLNTAPLNELKINDLIWLPKFLIKEVEYYNYNDTAAGYRNQTITTGTWYTWADVKPEDKSEEGQYYDEDLFTKGYKEITAVNEDGVRYQYVAGVQLCPYYGKSSSTYNPATDSYTSGTNPDDGFIYSSRQIFGSYTSDTDTYPKVGTQTTNRPLLYVCSEIYNAMTGGITYQIPTGIVFGNVGASGTISSDFNVQSQWQFSSNTQLINSGISGFYTNFWVNNNQYYNGIFKGVNDPTVESVNPDFYTASSIATIDGSWISTAMADSSYPAAAHYYLQNNSPMSFSFAKTNRTISPQTLSYFSIQELWATIASLGCYVADGVDCATTAQTGRYTGNNNHLYLGYMDQNGITNGTMLQGKDIENSTQAGIDDIIQNTPYTPTIPGPGGGGGGDYPSPNPSGENQPDYKGNNIPARTERNNLGNIGASATYYVLSDNLMGNFNSKLWGQPADFYEALQFTLDATPSIFDYIISCTYYPLNLSSYKGSPQDVYMGTGAKFGLNEYVLNTLSATLDFGSISLTDPIFHPYEGNEAFLNLNPYTKVSITIPYAGSYDLNASEVAGGTLALTGDLSFITGKITYTLTLTTAEGSTYPILKHSAKVGCDMKLSGTDGSRQAAQMVSSGINWGKSLLSTTGSIFTNGEKAVGNSLVGNVVGAVSGLSNIANSVADFTADTASLALSSKEIPLQIGNSDGFDAIFSTQVAYITVYRPKISNPPNYGHATGYLTEGTSKISSLTGFTICRNPDVSGINATQDEKNEIQSILTTGFYA